MHEHKTLSELWLECGLRQISMKELLALPDDNDEDVAQWLDRLLDLAYDADDDNDDNRASTMVLDELKRLWDEGLALTTKDSIVKDHATFWRMLTLLPAYFFYADTESQPAGDNGAEPDDGAIKPDKEAKPADNKFSLDDGKTKYRVNEESLVEVLQFGFIANRDMPLALSDFEEILTLMPDEICCEFLCGLDDVAKLQCMMRLVLPREGWLYCIDETTIRLALQDASSQVQVAMLELFNGLGVIFNLDLDAAYDPDWVEARGEEGPDDDEFDVSELDDDESDDESDDEPDGESDGKPDESDGGEPNKST